MMQCEATLSHQKGILISHGDGIGVSNSLVEGTNSDRIMIIDSRNIHLTDSIVVGNVGNGIVITTQGVNMTQCLILIKGCIVNSNNKNGIGIWAKNGNQISHINIAGCTITNSGSGSRGNPDQPEFWDGINISNDPTTGGNCRLIKIFGCFIGNRIGVTCTQKYGIRSLENSDCIQVFYNDFFQNIAANHSLVGLQNSIGENGVSRLEN